MMNIILIVLLSTLTFAGPREEADELLHTYSSYRDLATRLDLISRTFKGLPYGEGGPLGEGVLGRYDQDPLYRFDTFDCTTFIETVMSLALAKNTDEFEKWMNDIRYENGEIDYLKRNHFPSLQWIPNNIRNGVLVEINELILPINEIKMAEAVINLPGWLTAIKIEEIKVPMASREERQSLLEELQSLSRTVTPVVARLQYLPIETLLKKPFLLDKIPHATIVNFVRPNWDIRDLIGTHMNVSHQGLIFKTKKGVFLRHATTAGKIVKEEELLGYLKKFENHPTLKGIHLMKMNHQTL